jgi:hypothetical protein
MLGDCAAADAAAARKLIEAGRSGVMGVLGVFGVALPAKLTIVVPAAADGDEDKWRDGKLMGILERDARLVVAGLLSG